MAFEKYTARKDPDSVVDYGRVWSEWLDNLEDIVSSIWIITSADEQIPTLEESNLGTGISDDKKSTSIWLKGGTAGIRYNLTNRITTSENRVEDTTGIVIVENK